MKEYSLFRRGFARAESWLDKAFTPQLNPMTQLGALGYYCYWIVAVSGIYLYIAFDTSITGVYQSMEYLTNEQWYLGGIMRSLHRYASDAMVFFMFLHLARELAFGRLTGARAFSWLTGVPIILLVYASGITGYWLVWDELAQYIAIVSSEWFDWLPIFGESIARNFIAPDTVDDRFFSLMIFMHIFAPLFLLLLMWIHIQRISKSKVNPTRGLAIGMMVMFLVLSLISPATSHEAADLTKVPSDLNYDWYYLTFYPLLDMLPAGFVWAIALVLTILMLGVPYVLPGERRPAAEVNLDNCNGCQWCWDDCPYSAITMVPRTDGKPYERQAEVNANLCVGCGICAGACPTGSPFRRGDRLVPGIELPDFTLATLRDQLKEECAPLVGDNRVLVVNCEHGASVEEPSSKTQAQITLPCVSMFPPSFMDFVLAQNLADGIVLAACGDGECFNRTGLDWTRQRLERTRDPRLRRRVQDVDWTISIARPGENNKLTKEVSDFADGLSAKKATPKEETSDAVS